MTTSSRRSPRPSTHQSSDFFGIGRRRPDGPSAPLQPEPRAISEGPPGRSPVAARAMARRPASADAPKYANCPTSRTSNVVESQPDGDTRDNLFTGAALRRGRADVFSENHGDDDFQRVQSSPCNPTGCRDGCSWLSRRVAGTFAPRRFTEALRPARGIPAMRIRRPDAQRNEVRWQEAHQRGGSQRRKTYDPTASIDPIWWVPAALGSARSRARMMLGRTLRWPGGTRSRDGASARPQLGDFHEACRPTRIICPV